MNRRARASRRAGVVGRAESTAWKLSTVAKHHGGIVSLTKPVPSSAFIRVSASPLAREGAR